MKSFATGQYPLTRRKGYLTVKSSAMRYLADHVDPDDETLVFLWGSFGIDQEPHWLVSACSEASLPGEAQRQGVQGQLDEMSFVVVQSQHLPKLDGRSLVYENGVLAVK